MRRGTETCVRCGYAVGLQRVALMVEGRLLAERLLCAKCRGVVADALDPPRWPRSAASMTPWSQNG